MLDRIRKAPERIKEELKKAPERLEEALEKAPERLEEALKDAPERLRARGRKVQDRVEERLHELREEGEEKAWTAETRVLERAGRVIDRASGLPVVSRVAPGAGRFVQERLEAVTRPPVSDFDDLNARNAALAARGLSRVDLQKLLRYEKAHKDRKTVREAIEAELRRPRSAVREP